MSETKSEVEIGSVYITPKVAVIGRPNVGKSTLFNIITGTRKAVVKNQPGVTRDIIIEPVEVWGKQFDLIDTGGITEAGDLFSKLIREHVAEFLQSVDLVIAVMDGRVGLLPEDRDIIKFAKLTGKPFLLVINKVDRVDQEEIAKADFYEFGVDIVSASFEQRRGLSDILEWITNQIPESQNIIPKGARLAIVGKPNVGKSSLSNNILGSNRMLVSAVAGTTIDAVETPFIINNVQYMLVDTAGLRRSSRREEDVEIISAFKSQEAIRRADIVLLVIDGTQGPTEQDSKIMQAILEDHRGVIVVANKIDIAQKEIPEFKKTFKAQMDRNFHFFEDVPVVFTSAKTGQGVDDLFQMIEHVTERLSMKIPTSELNDFFFQTIRKAPAPVWGNNNVKFYYLTQTMQQPPAFIAFCNFPDGVTTAYRRFLIKNIKTHWDLQGIPIRIFCMKTRKG
jgi:GTP-binding protein